MTSGIARFNLNGQYLKISFLVIIIFECLSFLAFTFSPLNQALFILIVVAAFVISLFRLDIGAYILLTELIIGGKGYLFSLDFGHRTLSIRIGLFIAIIAATIIQLARKKGTFPRNNVFFSAILVALLAVVYGLVRGYFHGNALVNIFFDANGYFYTATALVFFITISSLPTVERLLQVMYGASLAVSLKTLFILSYFAHSPSAEAQRAVYTWIRNTGVGEMTDLGHYFFRVFFQSHIFLLFIFFFSLSLLIIVGKKFFSPGTYRILMLSSFVSGAVIVVNFSRSFWLAAAGTLILFFIFLVKKWHRNFLQVAKLSSILALGVIAELVFLTALVNFPIPGHSSGNVTTASLVRERLESGTSESAVSSRIQLLKPLALQIMKNPLFGSGFGTTVTYKTKDPRASAASGGNYTTYAFEWGYLDLLAKLGLIGAAAYLFFSFKILKTGFHVFRSAVNPEDQAIIFGLILSFIALLFTHATTPYLNHPLGIGYSLVIASIFALYHRHPSMS